jgi:MFS family permease
VQVAAVVIGLVGLIFNFGVTIGLGVAIGLMVGVATQVASDHREHHEGTRVNTWRWVATGVAAGPVLAGLAVLFGEATWLIVLLGLGAGIWGYHARRRRSRSGPPTVAALEVSEPTDYLARLSNSELRREWRASHARLRSARDGTQLALLRELRRRQLDEMERRDPSGFRRWFGSGEWISGSSAPFLDR